MIVIQRAIQPRDMLKQTLLLALRRPRLSWGIPPLPVHEQLMTRAHEQRPPREPDRVANRMWHHRANVDFPTYAPPGRLVEVRRALLAEQLDAVREADCEQ